MPPGLDVAQAAPVRSAPEWHHLTVEAALESLSTDLNRGLTSAEAEVRRSRYGSNTITQRRGAGPLKRALSQFNQALVIILIAAGAITAALQEWVDSGVIFGVVVINAIIGYLQEAKAVKAIEALSRSMSTETTALRDGQRTRIPASALVPGDIVHLQAGDKVPADMRLTYVRDLRVDESALTGESLPVEKAVQPLATDTTLADRTNMAYASTLVTTGQGAGVVVMTGDATEVGRISHLIAEAKELKTPLTRKIAAFSRLLLYVILGLAALTAIVGIIRGEAVVDMFMAAVALAVGAIPEGLPAAVTITLAIGVSRMARRRAIVRKLPAVETLGSTTVICSDKTGTLTENQMTVQLLALAGSVFTVTGAGYDPAGVIEDDDGSPGVRELLLAGLLCNDSSVYKEDGEWHISGDPTEAALLVSAAKAGLNRDEMDRVYPRLDTVPFESEHQYMATLHSLPERAGAANAQRRAYVKGAVEKILDRCRTQSTSGGQIAPLDRAWVQRQAEAMASQGLRVLAFASKDFPSDVAEISHDHVRSDLVFLGLQGMIDPPRSEAIEAVKACHTAGIQVRMITGDHALTAAAIAKRLNLKSIGTSESADPHPLTGAELAAMSDDALAEAIRNTYVFARVTPEQKLRLVTALQRHGHVVAMTGDGVNDAPALRQADIGVAMGVTGTEVAKEAADMVLTDDNFASIEAAVEEGRGVFDNITKFITWTLPTNLGEGLVILAAIFAGVSLPILPVQILWINMTTAVLLGLMLAFEPKESGIMERPPRPPQAPLLSGILIGRVVIVGVLLLAGAFALFEWGQQTGHTLEQSRTIAANVFVFGELFYLFNCRSLLRPSWHSRLWANKFLLAGAILMIALQLLYTYAPVMNDLFGSAPISITDWGWILVSSAAVHLLIELEKWIRRRRQRE